MGDQYWSFQIGDGLNDKHRLEVSGYSGDAGDSLQYESDWLGNGQFGFYYHNGMQFSTFDQDNDNNGGSCASVRAGGWWYNNCYFACLMCDSSNNQWVSMPGGYYVVNSRMMIKPQ